MITFLESCAHCHPPMKIKDLACIPDGRYCKTKDGWLCSTSPDRTSTIDHKPCHHRGKHGFYSSLLERRKKEKFEWYISENLIMVIFTLVTCKCSTPGKGTKGNNEMKCSNGETRTCASNEECFASNAFVYGQWNNGCRIPGNILRVMNTLISRK